MGNKQSLKTRPYSQKQFITQAHMDWMHQMQNLFLEKPTMTKTVILPPGVHLDDERINDGVVVAERKYSLPLGKYPEWPESIPFECDVDKLLLPPCQGQEHMETHYAVYPNEYFPEVSCAYCNANVNLCRRTSEK
ncbi:uncharacterized protein LOC128883214 isoform X2 [Hylaeus volcanicus]|nr:uncharacterized protein LOC128883214 isoform X2 [Hylaeus volcanicus]